MLLLLLALTGCTEFLSGVRERVYVEDHAGEEIGSITISLGDPEPALPRLYAFYTRADRNDYCQPDCFDVTNTDVTKQATWWIDDSFIAELHYPEFYEGNYVSLRPLGRGSTTLHIRYERWRGNAFIANVAVTVH